MLKNLATLSSLLSLWYGWSRQYAVGVFIAACLFVIPSGECVAQNEMFFDQVLFNNQSLEQYQEQWRERHKAELASAISYLDSYLALSDQQIAKFRLAGELDIERSVRDRERIRNEAAVLQMELHGNVAEVQRAVTPHLQRSKGKFFDDESLFAKTIRTTLSSEQRETEFGRDLFNRDLVFRGMILCRRQPEPSEFEKRIRLIELHAQETNRSNIERLHHRIILQRN